MKLQLSGLLGLMFSFTALSAPTDCRIAAEPFEIDQGGSHYKIYHENDREIGFASFDGLGWTAVAKDLGSLTGTQDSKEAATTAVCQSAS